MREGRFQLTIAPDQGIVVAVGDLRRVRLVVEPVVAGDLGGQARELFRRLCLGRRVWSLVHAWDLAGNELLSRILCRSAFRPHPSIDVR